MIGDILARDQRQQRHRRQPPAGPDSCSGKYPSSRCASLTSASTSCSRAAVSSHVIAGLPGSS